MTLAPLGDRAVWHQAVRRDTAALVRLTLPPIISMPDRVDMEIYRGDDLIFDVAVFNWDDTEADLTSTVASSQIRESWYPSALLAELVTSITDNVITCHLLHDDSNDLPGRCAWDLQLTHGALIHTILAGSVGVTPDVTRP